MKPKKLKLLTVFLFLLPLCMVILGAGCNDDVRDTACINQSYEIIESLKDVIGIVGIDNSYNEFIINIHKQGTIDEIIVAYPCELSKEFKKAGIKVILDGNLFVDADLPEPSLGGQEIFRIDIQTISITN